MQSSASWRYIQIHSSMFFRGNMHQEIDSLLLFQHWIEECPESVALFATPRGNRPSLGGCHKPQVYCGVRRPSPTWASQASYLVRGTPTKPCVGVANLKFSAGHADQALRGRRKPLVLFSETCQIYRRKKYVTLFHLLLGTKETKSVLVSKTFRAGCSDVIGCKIQRCHWVQDAAMSLGARCSDVIGCKCSDVIGCKMQRCH